MQRNSHQFIPPWWLRGAHLQSCFNTIFSPRCKTSLIWEQLELPDGDFLDLCWAGSFQASKTVVLLHGLEGSVESHYIQCLMDGLVAQGWCAVLMHFRGCSGRLNRLARSYHAGEIGDLSYLIDVLRIRFPNNPLCAVGFSLGGNVLLNYLAKVPNPVFRCAMAISIPFQLELCARSLPPFYQRRLLGTMKEKALAKVRAGYDMPVGEKELMTIDDFCHFDDMVTAPLHGFCSMEDYYGTASIRGLLKKINQPTLIVHALDDPLIPIACIPHVSELSPAICLELHQQGGHVGFIQGTPWNPKYWLKDRILDFLNQSMP